MIAQPSSGVKPPPETSADASRCACGNPDCRRHWLFQPDGELDVFDDDEGVGIRTWLPDGVTLRRLAAGEQAQNIQTSGSNGATVLFANGKLYVADPWHALAVYLPDGVALVFDPADAQQPESEADRG